MSPNTLASTDAVAPVQDDVTSPDPFSAVPQNLRLALQKRGFDSLTAVQTAVLEAEADGRDLQISSQTGSGKTVALGFVLAPLLETPRTCKGPEAIIIVPTRELAMQVCGELAWLFAGITGASVLSVTGGSPVYLDRKQLARGLRVLVGTPGRMLDHVKTGVLDLSNVRELVLDEADQMLDMGFRDELDGILKATPETRRTHMVSATFPGSIQRMAKRYQQDPFKIEGTRLGEANQDIEHQGHCVHYGDRYAALVNLLLLADGERVLVFVEQRIETTALSSRLEADGFAALPLSGELAQTQRVNTLASFRAGRATVLVATDVAARGLDVPDVMTVIHTSPPLDAETYTHRSGRTGRAGMRGKSVLLAPPNRRRRIARLLSEAGVDLRWCAVPTAVEVREELTGRARAALEKDLDASVGEGASASELEYAENLLVGRDPIPLVAALLARLKPAGRAQPKDVQTAAMTDDSGRREFQHRGRPTSYSGGRSSHTGGRSSQRRDFKAAGEMVRFFVNWGGNQGANPNRLLAAICRRGSVSGSDVGSIAIHPNASTFDIRKEVAERFERLAGKRDPRDPKTRIRRDQTTGPKSKDHRS